MNFNTFLVVLIFILFINFFLKKKNFFLFGRKFTDLYQISFNIYMNILQLVCFFGGIAHKSCLFCVSDGEQGEVVTLLGVSDELVDGVGHHLYHLLR